MCAQNNKPQEVLKNSPLFRLSLSSKELFHSNFLEWLSTENRDAFRKLINRMAGLPEKYNWKSKNWRVKREFNNFDLCVVAYDEEDSSIPVYSKDDDYIDDDTEYVNMRILFIIENKVKSIPYKEQVIKYAKKAKTINKKYPDQDEPKYVLLTLTRQFPDMPETLNNSNSIWELTWKEKGQKQPKKCVWHICYYDEYANYIEQNYPTVPQQSSPADLIIKDYVSFIRSLSSLSEIWAMDYRDYLFNKQPFLYYKQPFLYYKRPSFYFYHSTDDGNKAYNTNYLIAKQLRIHDLYQKQKFSFLCTELYKIIKDKYNSNSIFVFPSNQGGLFKDKFFSEPGRTKQYICVNYTYLHGEPLLEINIHPVCIGNTELYYAIQVQGDAYERGVQVKKRQDVSYDKTKKGRGKGKDDIANYVWTRLSSKPNGVSPSDCPNKDCIKIIDKWMTIPNVSSWDELSPFLLDIGNNSPYYAYNMSDGAYIYQKRTIINNPSIASVIDKMLSDLEYVITELKMSTP